MFVGPYEHHSNILPWREAGCKTIELNESISGGVDMNDLHDKIQQYGAYRYKYAAISVCSNVTGILTDTIELQRIFYDHNIVCMYDYATAAPYVDIDMNPTLPDTIDFTPYKKHCIAISTHKMLGGVQTPGIMIIKKSLLHNTTPLISGGGTVFYVTDQHHRYIENYSELYEGGTQSIVESIRAGLVFQLKSQIGVDYIRSTEHQYLRLAVNKLSSINNLIILGNENTMNRLPIISFLIYCTELQSLLHSNYVSVLLNDLFGIQSRSGCMCAGPYSHRILGISAEIAGRLESCLLHKQELMRPGFVRINLHYTHTSAQVNYILSCIEWLCAHAYKLLPLYSYNIESGEWRHKTYQNKFIGRRWLSNINYNNNSISYPTNYKITKNIDVYEYLSDADTIANHALQQYTTLPDQSNELNDDAQKLRWFVLPYEVLNYIKTNHIQHHTRTYSILPPTHKHLFISNHSNDPGNVMNDTEHDDSKATETHNSNKNNNLSTAAESKRKSNASSSQHNTIDDKRHKPSSNISTDTTQLVCRNCYHTHQPFNNSNSIQPTAECLSCQCITYQPLHKSINTNKLLTKTFKQIKSHTGRAIRNYNMITDGDRILVGVSGGKDSLTLVNILLELQRKSPVKFSIGCCTVDPQTAEYNPKSLIPYFAALNVPYYYESHPILELAKQHMSSKRVSICSFCSRMKRGILYS